ncbi:hypothetical protein [Tenacibaculum sp. SG-28]|uniref:hypothetical protein n=1 Tax=Tenacibaculum sp. SG-28 TaxID=754426 RepID=UPI000CF4B114|nr:hypothetical protein [Tenacibaculum sp. SG-28]PQJ23482.1 hypothetical protein BSU00_04705 [Tenacibaculum sp. SG-28]
MKPLLIAIVSCNIISCCQLQSKPSFKESKIVSNFFKTYDGKPQKAIEDIFNSNKWLNFEKSQKETVFLKLNNLISQLGSYQGYETIKSINIGKSYRVISAIAKYDRQPLRFNFILYKPLDKWQVQNFNFDVNIESVLEQNITLSFDY